MSSNPDLEVRKREISTLVDNVIALEKALLAKGIDARDEFDRLEAIDIINRIERRILANMPAASPAKQAAE
jgi:hypothetical protein